MRHKSHIGLIDTHTKGNSGNDHNTFFLQKTTLVLGANLCR